MCSNKDDTMTKAEFKLKGNETYLRIECCDKYGKTAWTNAVFFHQLAFAYFFLSKDQKIALTQIHICSNSSVGSPIFSAIISAVVKGITKIRLSYISLSSVPHQTGALLNKSFNFNKVESILTNIFQMLYEHQGEPL